MNRQRYKKRVREDAQTWRDRIVGKRIVTEDPEIAAHDGWKSADNPRIWEPRIYFNKPIGEGFDKDLVHETQKASPLLQLPAEIRNHILELALPPQTVPQENESDGWENGDVVWMRTSAIIFTCKQLYAEGRALAISQHTFPYENFPRKTRLCGRGELNHGYIWDLLNVVCDTKTNVVKQVLYG